MSISADTLGKLLTRGDANTGFSETFGYDNLNRLTSSSVNLTPTPLVKIFGYSAIGNLTSKSDVGTYSYPASGQARPHGVTSISGSINTTFTYDAKGNMTSGNGLTVAYASYNKPTTITRGITSLNFSHDPEHQRFKQVAPTGAMIYAMGSGVLAELFTGSGSSTTWTNYLFAGGQLIGKHVQISGGTVHTKYFGKDHLGSISTLTDENGVVVARLSYDAWGKRRFPNGADDPSDSITSGTTRGFTGQEELDSVTLVHMNGRVYDPLLGRFGVPDPTTESPFSTQGWNRYSYVGNSPVNFTDPTGYCFMGFFWKSIFSGLQHLFRQVPILGSIVQIGATAICGMIPVCAPFAPLVAGLTAAFVSGVTSGNLGLALKAGLIAGVTAYAMFEVGEMTQTFGPEGGVGPPSVPGGHGELGFLSDAPLFNIAGHALVGCVSAVASRGKCGAGALSVGAGSFAGPLLADLGFQGKLVATSVVGGLASVAGGGKFANGAVTAAFGYLFNECAWGGCAAKYVYDEPALPSAPPGVSIDEGVQITRAHFDDSIWWFYDQVKSGGDWDFKHWYGSQYEDFGNFFYENRRQSFWLERFHPIQ